MADDLLDGLAVGSPPAKGFHAERWSRRIGTGPAAFAAARAAMRDAGVELEA